MQRAFGKSAYKTVFLLTILTLGIALGAFTLPTGAIDALEIYDVDDDVWTLDNHGNVGDDDVAVNGTGAYAFAVVSIYWDSIEPDNLLTTTTADNLGYFETDEGDIVIPEDVGGDHWIIAHDGDSANLGATFVLDPEIELDPEEGLPDDRVDVTGTGFGEEEDIELYFDLGGLYEEEVTRGTPSTDVNGSFETWFYLPDVDEDDWGDFEVFANDTSDPSFTATATFTVGEYIDVDPDEGYPTYGPIDWDARADANEDYQVVFVGVDLWISLANVTSDDEGEMSGTFYVPVESMAGDYGPYYMREYQVELWDEDDDFVAGHDFDVYPYPHLEAIPDGAKANETVDIVGGFFSREEDTEVTVTLDGIEIGVFETDADGNFTDEFEVPDIQYGHYTLTAIDENGYEAEADFDVLPEKYTNFGTRATVYFQGDKFSFWANFTEPDTTPWDGLFLNVTDPDGVLFLDERIWWDEFQLLEGEFTDYYVLPYNLGEDEWCCVGLLPDDAKVGTWNWTVVLFDDLYEGYDYDDDEWSMGTFEVVERLTLDLVMDQLDEMKAQIEGLITDTNGDLVALINTNHGTLTASLSDLNAKVVDIEGDTATLLTDLGMVKADVADIAGEFPLDIPETDLTPMWAAVALSLVAAIAAIAAVVIVYQRIA
jgi:hypothetical protein